MKTHRFSSQSMFDLMSKISTVLESFSNVELVEVYQSSTNEKRYLFKIDGFDYDYLYMRNQNSMIRCGFILRTASHGTSYRFTVDHTPNVSIGYETLLYTISNKNVLKSFSLASPPVSTSTPNPQFITFDIEDDKSYVIYDWGSYVMALENASTTIQKYIHFYEPYCCDSEKVIQRKPILTDTNAVLSTFYRALDNVYIFSNIQFLNYGVDLTAIPCISIDGDKFRQVYSGCVFVEDSD